MATEKKAKEKKQILVACLSDAGARISGTNWAQQILDRIPACKQTTPGEADILILNDITTNDHNKNSSIINHFLSLSRSKPMLVFLHDDPSEPMTTLRVPEKNCSDLILLRTSLNRSTKKSYERLLPSFQAEDNNTLLLEPAVCTTPHKPLVGFCGVVRWPSRRLSCDALLERPDLFDTSFVFRTDHHTRQTKEEEQQRCKQEFQDIMKQCPYQLCCRGGGNFSHRFFETLASGRIPVLIDTDTVLAEHVPTGLWQRCVVLAKDAESLPHALLAFHNQYPVVTTQICCRILWQKYLSLNAYAPFIEKHMRFLLGELTEEEQQEPDTDFLHQLFP